MTYRTSFRRRPGRVEWAVSGPFNREVARGFASSREAAERAASAAVDADIYEIAELERSEHERKYGPPAWLDEPGTERSAS